MYDIVLINPPLPIQAYKKDDICKRVPVGLFSIGSVLAEAGYRSQIIDGVVDPDYRDKIFATKEKNVLFYGISCMTAQISSSLEIGKILRDIAPGKPIVWGGVHPTLFPEQTCLSEAADVVVIGEGEYTSLEIANAFKEGSTIASIKGIAYKENGLIKINPLREVRSLDELPFPRYDILDVERYLHKNINEVGPKLIKKSMVIYAGIGCPFNCAFCINTAFARKLQRERYRAKSAIKVLNEIGYLIDKYGVEDIHFQDELFFARKSRLIEIVEGIKVRGYKITWSANVYAGYFNEDYLNEKVFEKVAQSGCHRLTMGVESGCERVHKIIRKKIRLDQVERSAYLSREYGVTMGYSFMMGIPGETREEVMQTLKFIKKLLSINPKNYILGPQLFRPYPGSDFYALWKEKGGKEPKTLKEWAYNLSLESSTYVAVKELPWIQSKDRDFFLILSAVGSRYYLPLKNMPLDKKTVFRLILLLAFKLRMKLNFWRYPIERKLLQLYRTFSTNNSMMGKPLV